jgi:hypothetical protein
MKYELFEEIVLLKDMPQKKLKRGDIATVVEYHSVPNGEDGYSLEFFNAIGDTIAVITVPESAIKSLSENEIFNVRSFFLHDLKSFKHTPEEQPCSITNP